MPEGATLIRLNLLASYGVDWDAQTFVRDIVQNFFDAAPDFADVRIDVRPTERVVRIEGPTQFSLEYLRYIGATSKSSGRFAGQFGEGFKVCALVGLRDFGLEITAGAGTWRIAPAFETVSLGEELVYRQWSDVEIAGAFVELHGCSDELLSLFAESKRFFRWPGNPRFGECLFSDGEVHLYRAAHASGGEVYYGKQLRAELGPDVPFTFCVDSLAKLRKDRDRRALTRVQRDNVVRAVAARLPFAAARQVIHGLKHKWSTGSYTLEALVGGLQVDPLFFPEHTIEFPPEWVAAESSASWAEANAYARRSGYKVGVSYLARVGMRSAYDVWRNDTAWVEDGQLDVVQRARRDLLLWAGKWLHTGSFPQVKLARMSNRRGEHRGDAIVLNVLLLGGDFSEALSVYLHELCHEYGRDGDARFSDALTAMLQVMVREAKMVSCFQEAWQTLVAVDAGSLEYALRVSDVARRAQGLLRLTEERGARHVQRAPLAAR